MPHITPFLWFDNRAEEAGEFLRIARRVMEAMLKMKKIIIDDLERAYEG